MNKKYNEKNAAATAVEICGTLVYRQDLAAVIAAAEKRLAALEPPKCMDDGQLTPEWDQEY